MIAQLCTIDNSAVARQKAVSRIWKMLRYGFLPGDGRIGVITPKKIYAISWKSVIYAASMHQTALQTASCWKWFKVDT